MFLTAEFFSHWRMRIFRLRGRRVFGLSQSGNATFGGGGNVTFAGGDNPTSGEEHGHFGSRSICGGLQCLFKLNEIYTEVDPVLEPFLFLQPELCEPQLLSGRLLLPAG